ncbi:hypothetical protein [Roseimicrobium gellanilyticum]|nr:hypothetical protein [Roseimicrobium gellanilyticum]
MILLIVVLILFRMMITRAGNAATEKLKQMHEDEKLREEVQRSLDAGKEQKDPLVEELQKRIDAAHDPLDELKPRTAPAPESERAPAPSPTPPPSAAEPSVNSPSR